MTAPSYAPVRPKTQSKRWAKRVLTPQEKRFVELWCQSGATLASYRSAYNLSADRDEPNADEIDKRMAKNIMVRVPVRRAIARINAAIDKQIDKVAFHHPLGLDGSIDTKGLSTGRPRDGGAGIPPDASFPALVASKEWVVARLTELAAINIKNYVRWTKKGGIEITSSDNLTEAQAYGIASITESRDRAGKVTTRIKFVDKEKALVDLAKVLGLARGDNEPPPPPADERRRRENAREAILRVLTSIAIPAPMVIEGDVTEVRAAAPLEPRGGEKV